MTQAILSEIAVARIALEKAYSLMVRGKGFNSAIQYQKAKREWEQMKELTLVRKT